MNQIEKSYRLMMLPVFTYPDKSTWKELLQRPSIDSISLEASVSNILKEVKANGDEAVKRFASMFDKVTLTELQITETEINNAESFISYELKSAILQAKKNIEKFHHSQSKAEMPVETMPGINCWRKNVAIEKIGLYIPGGSAPLFSTILMLGVPAVIAGCSEIVLCSPPDRNGNLHPAILYTAKLVGITKIFKAGGPQAIAAMAYGTQSIPKVYKIFGPGNQYVTSAKQLVQKDGVAIDIPAGPSEVAVLADDSAIAEFVASDLLSQAEHGPDSQVILVTISQTLIDNIKVRINDQLEVLPRKEIALQSLQHSKIILVRSIEEGIEFINLYAPEHLIIACNNEDHLADLIINAGSVFLGNYSPESVGDYASGTNHTLPTSGYARAYSGVSIDSFVKKITYQRLSREGLQNIGPVVEVLAKAEGLNGHAAAVSIRLQRT